MHEPAWDSYGVSGRGVCGEEVGGGFGESFRYKDKSIIDKLLLEGRQKNEDIIMMTEGIKNLIGEEDNIDDDSDEFNLLQD